MDPEKKSVHRTSWTNESRPSPGAQPALRRQNIEQTHQISVLFKPSQCPFLVVAAPNNGGKLHIEEQYI